MSQTTKQIILIVIAVIVIFVGYKVFFVNPDGGNDTLQAVKINSDELAEGQVILSLLDKLNKVKLDEEVFSNKTFVSLVDFEREIADQVKGRQNPFLPIGVENSSSALFRSASTTARTR